jgi:hypothetical protein
MAREYNFKVDVSMDDYEAFNVFVTNQAFKKNRIIRMVIGGALILFGAFNFYLANFTLKTDVIIFFLVGSFWVLLLPMLSKQGVKRRARTIVKNARPGAVIGYREITVSEEHIWYKSELYDNKLKWGVIQKLDQMPSHVLIYLAETSALIIPNSAIGDANAILEFVTFAQAQLDKSQNKEEIAAHLVG